MRNISHYLANKHMGLLLISLLQSVVAYRYLVIHVWFIVA